MTEERRKCEDQKTSKIYSAEIAPERKGNNKCPVVERGKDDASMTEKEEKKLQSIRSCREKMIRAAKYQFGLKPDERCNKNKNVTYL